MKPSRKKTQLARLDQRYVWHPFTQMQDWLRTNPIVITSGEGAVLRDDCGNEYLDGNSSIWTNLHGHNHSKINAAISKQLKKIAHSSALGFANEPASLLAEKLVELANPKSIVLENKRHSRLGKVFYSDDGSTALEVALKLCHEFTRRTGKSKKPRFLSLDGAYHGDTVGAVSLGHIDLFHKAYSGLLFKTDKVMSPYCYRCPFNRARPERADAREYRKCNWECVGKVEQAFDRAKKRKQPFAAFVYEPLMQGAAGMIPQPQGWLKKVCGLARAHGAQLIADEVMTGFGRCSSSGDRNQKPVIRNQRSIGIPQTQNPRPKTPSARRHPPSPIFASHTEDVQPDYLCLAKGLTGGYLPMAATLTTQAVFDSFLGEYDEFKTFFHGHSYTGNQLGASAGLANLTLLESLTSIKGRQRIETALINALPALWDQPNVGDIRRVGLVVGIELVKNWQTRQPFDLREQAGVRVCQAMAKRGVLTRPIGNVIVLMPPYCTAVEQVKQMIGALYDSIAEVLGGGE